MINCSFISMLICFMHNQTWSYKAYAKAIKVLQMTWTLTLFALNGNMLYSLIISWFRSWLWEKGSFWGLFSASFYLWVKRVWTRSVEWENVSLDTFILTENYFLLPLINIYIFFFRQSSEADFDLTIIIYLWNLWKADIFNYFKKG